MELSEAMEFDDYDDYENNSIAMEYLEWWLEGPILLVMILLGLLGNLVFIAMFTCKWRNLNTFHRFGVSSTRDCPYMSTYRFDPPETRYLLCHNTS